MPSVELVVQCPRSKSFRSAQVAGMFDYARREKECFQVKAELPLSEKPWQIGLIVGPSGSGKTLLANHLWADEVIDKFIGKSASVIP